MTQPADLALLELAERLEQATGPDRELDCDIACALFGGEIIWRQASGTMEPYPSHKYPSADHVAGYACGPVPAFTASLDAGMALVLERWQSAVMWDRDEREAYAAVGTNAIAGFTLGDGKSKGLNAIGAKARALTAACLRARAHLQENSNG